VHCKNEQKEYICSAVHHLKIYLGAAQLNFGSNGRNSEVFLNRGDDTSNRYPLLHKKHLLTGKGCFSTKFGLSRAPRKAVGGVLLETRQKTAGFPPHRRLNFARSDAISYAGCPPPPHITTRPLARSSSRCGPERLVCENSYLKDMRPRSRTPRANVQHILLSYTRFKDL
jgi:hypothetical protein